MSTCGVGGWGGVVPGDPSNNSILSAVPAFGGIDVSWTYPTTNPHAVAYTKIYRSATNDFNAAILIKETSGTSYYDRVNTATQFYYWIRLISVHGTQGAVIGPASAIAVPLLVDLMAALTGEIDSGVLATSLRTELDQISIINTNLLNEIVDRETGETTLATAMAAVELGVAAANTYILDEINTRTTETSALAESIDGVVVTLGADLAAAVVTMTATTDGITGRLTSKYLAQVTVTDGGTKLIGGFGLYNDGTSVEAGFDVDRFWIGRTAGDKLKPFIIDGGVVYIREAVIPVLTADKIDTRNLTIKDGAGTVIFSSGVPLAPANADTALRNSSIGINANGTLSGAGSGQVSIGGLGYSGDLGATRDISLVVTGTGLVLAGNSCNRPSGGGSWDSQCYSVDGFTGGAYCSFVPNNGTSSYFMAGLNTDPTTDASYTSLDYCLHIGGSAAIHAWALGVATSVGTYVAGDVLSLVYDGQFVRYLQNGNLLRVVGAPPGLKLYFDSSILNHGLNAIKFGPFANSNSSRSSSLVDTSWWNQTINPTTVWGPNGAGTDAIVSGVLPDGSNGLVWRATHDASGLAGGGWNPSSNVTNNFPVDSRKAYMFAVYTKGISGTGSQYWGVDKTCLLNTTTPVFNWFTGLAKDNGVWHLHVGYVFPYGSTGHTNAGAGTYSCATGVLLSAGVNSNWIADPQSASTLAYQYYGSSGAQQDFAWPMVFVCDGSEPSIDDLLSMSSVSGRNKITSGNVSSYLGVGAVGDTYIASLNADKINVGTLNVDRIANGTITNQWQTSSYATVTCPVNVTTTVIGVDVVEPTVASWAGEITFSAMMTRAAYAAETGVSLQIWGRNSGVWYQVGTYTQTFPNTAGAWQNLICFQRPWTAALPVGIPVDRWEVRCVNPNTSEALLYHPTLSARTYRK